MKRIMFDDKYGLTEAVLRGEKTQIRCNSCRYKVGEVVAIAQSYKDVYDEMSLETMDMLVQPLKWSAGWNNKMFVKADLMPHHIRIIAMRQERLQDISDEDCLKEGIYGVIDTKRRKITSYYFPNSPFVFHTHREAYAVLIDKVNGKGTWESNPMVYVYDFELLD